MANPDTPRDSSSRVQIIVAVIGLVGVIATAVISNWGNIFPNKTAGKGTTVTTSTGSGNPKKYERPVHSNGRLIVRGTFHYDLDDGKETTAGADFWWEQQSTVKRYLTPTNGANFFVVGIKEFESIRYSDMEHYPYSAEKIDGSDGPSSRIPAGTVVAYKTNEGRLGKFIVDEYGYNLTISWRTFD
jgi:hypothetical protein